MSAERSEPALERPESALERFRRSMIVDFDMWHDGTGYDLDALRSLQGVDRDEAERLLIRRAGEDWRDVEALAVLDTEGARRALRESMRSADHSIRNAVARHAPHLVERAELVDVLVCGLQTAVVYGGLTQTLLQVERLHASEGLPPEVIDALLRGALEREGDVAVHLAAMVMHVHGKADSPFDWEQRPFFLRFATDDRGERETAFRDLCAAVDVPPDRFVS